MLDRLSGGAWDEWMEEAGYCFELEGKAKFQTYPLVNDERNLDCQSFSWEALDCREEQFEVCFNTTERHWYGAAQVYEQLWPIEQWARPSQPFINGVSDSEDEYGGVMHRYFLSSDGKAIIVEWDVPLWVAFNETGDSRLCLKGRYKDSPYDNYNNNPLYFNYTQCNGRDIKHVHEFITRNYLGKPSGIPDKQLFRHPIWTTWLHSGQKLNQSHVVDYAQNIVAHNLTASQLVISDQWEREYGRLEFDPFRFPKPDSMVQTIAELGMRTNLWVHPFIELTSDVLLDSAMQLNLVRDPGGILPGLVRWWNGVGAILDFTNNRSISRFVGKLRQLKDDYNISSFRFDAGETSYLPAAYKLKTPTGNPSRFTNRYATAAYVLNKRLRSPDVRVGAHTQELPVFVRMLNKKSRWSHKMGLKSIIPTALTFSILGYPYVLPDVVGGHDPGPSDAPERELYIRWLQAITLMPAMHFLVPPWHYDDEVVMITQCMLTLHEHYSDVIIQLAREASCTGAPIIRPLWWVAVQDEDALRSDSEFLLGDDILVAPVLELGARARDIYLPSGTWNDTLRGGQVEGKKWLTNYTVELHELAYFTRVT